MRLSSHASVPLIKGVPDTLGELLKVNHWRTTPLSRWPSPSRRPSPAACLVKAFYDYCSHGSLSAAVETLVVLAGKGIRLNAGALAFFLQQCAATGSLEHTRWAHLHLKTTGRKWPITFLSNQLLFSYLQCGGLYHARKLFDEMRTRNAHSWNTMIAGYVKFGKLKDAWELFDVMPERNVVSWNTMIVGLAKSGMCNEAVEFYLRLRGLGLQFSRYSFAGVLIACGKMGDVGLVLQVHGQVLVGGFSLNVVLASSILDGYAKCGAIGDARRLFDELKVRDVTCWTCMLSGYAKSGGLDAAWELFGLMPVKNSVSWTALISGHVEHGRVLRALELFVKMVELRFEPDQFTFSSVLCACASLGFLSHGKQIHATLIRTGFVPNAIVWSSLVDMYSKCGCLEAAKRVFRRTTSNNNLVLWNTMISALAQHGQGRETIQLYAEMVRLGIKPDDTTFIVVLQACNNFGFMEEGWKIFDSLKTFGVTPSKEHYACLVDALGSGRFA